MRYLLSILVVRQLAYILCVGLGLGIAYAQLSRADLERRKQQNLKKVAETERMLQQTKLQKTASIGQLKLLNEQIKAHEALLQTIATEIRELSAEIGETTLVISSLEGDFKRLRSEYSQMIYWAYKHRSGLSHLTFIFSASTFRQFFLRMKYLSDDATRRRKQLRDIQKVQLALEFQQKGLRGKRQDQTDLAQSAQNKQKNLLGIRKQKQRLVTTLRQRQSKLQRELVARRDALKRLNRLTSELIAREARAPVKSASYKELSSAFEKSRRRLPWPVLSGFISTKYGRQPHPVLKGVEMDNQGVDIQTVQNESITAVFEGIVARVAYVPGMNSVVILQHGDYYTLYARMSKVHVKTGQYVAVRESIGEVYTDVQGISEVQFQVWKKNDRLNPEDWLRGR